MASDIRKILCPTDWSEPSRVALQSAVRLAQREEAVLVLLHVLPRLGRVPGLASATALGEALQQEAFQKLVALVARYVPSDVQVQPVVRVGDQADEIYLAALGCDVVVMTTHGRAGWDGWAFGSVAQTVLRETACPIFVIGPSDGESGDETSVAGRLDLPFNKVLWPTDWSAPADHALREALAIAVRHDAQLLLLHVAPPPDAPQVATARWWDEQDAEAGNNFRALVERHPGAKDARRLVAHGLAAPEINRVAIAEGADVIVMSSHGQSGPNPSELGAVTRKVLRLVPCPVLLVPVAVPALAGAA